MKRLVHGPLLNYSPYLALALFLMLLLTSLNYFYLSAQNYQLLGSNTSQQKDIDQLQDELREVKQEKERLLRREEQGEKVLQKTEEDFNRCIEDKASLEESARNMSGLSVDSLVEKVTEYQENNTRLAAELDWARDQLASSNLSTAQLGRTIVRLREQVNSYNQVDAKDARKEYDLNSSSNSTAVTENNGESSESESKVSNVKQSGTTEREGEAASEKNIKKKYKPVLDHRQKTQVIKEEDYKND